MPALSTLKLADKFHLIQCHHTALYQQKGAYVPTDTISGNWLFLSEGISVQEETCRNYARYAGSSADYMDGLPSCFGDEFEREDIQRTTTIKIKSLIDEIKQQLGSMKDGRSSISPYDTAWVAFISDFNNSEKPLFPTSLLWIVENQLSDGSWGDKQVFSIYDRLLNTLACIIALTTWKAHLDKRNKGVTFIKANICKLETGNSENMTCGFEVVFPALLEKAQDLDIDLPYDAPILKEICARRELKLTRIPKELMHTVPTSLLFSLEGLRDLDWQKLMKLQMSNGSFLTSPASTAFAYMETNNDKCLKFLQNVVEEYDGGVPSSFPVDMQGRLWAIDRLQRLGISHYFVEEFKELLNHVYRYWNEDIGIFGARNSKLCDIDDTCMAIRLLRLHGFKVNPDVLKNFKENDEFFCIRGELDKSPTAMFNLYRASQVSFPREKILEEAKSFTYKFLQQCLANTQILDKWVISKDIRGEIQYALDVPWYASLPRVESRLYLDQYGGANDIWIAKTLYRLPDVSNNVYLEVAKLDYNKCQSQHRHEWKLIQEWFEKCKLQETGLHKKFLLNAYFLAAASVFEVEKSRERLAWAKSLVICKMIITYFLEEATTWTRRNSFLVEFNNHPQNVERQDSNKTREMVLCNLLQFLHQLSDEVYKDTGKDIHHQLHNAWGAWLMSLREEKSTQCFEEAELLVRTIILCAGHMRDDGILSDLEYMNLSKVTNKVCRMLLELQNKEVTAIACTQTNTSSPETVGIEAEMQGLVELAFSSASNKIDSSIKQTYFAVARSFYYTACISEETLNFHIVKVLFQKVQ